MDAIVIGSGMGGLTAAVLLGSHGGKRVLVLERHYEAGGFTHTFHRPGYEWDVGLHYIGQMQDAASPVRLAFDHVTAGKVKWQAMPELYDRLIFPARDSICTLGWSAFARGEAGVSRRGARHRRYIAAVMGAIARAARTTQRRQFRPLWRCLRAG